MTEPYTPAPRPRHTAKTRRLWERFNSNEVCLEDLADPHERMLVRAWEMCKRLGIDPALRKTAVVSEEELERICKKNAFLLDLAKSALDRVPGALQGIPGVLLFTDREGTILHVAGEPSSRLRSSDLSNFVRGAQFSESSAGTNSISASISQRIPVRTHAAEHYCEGWHQWTCTAAPILDPFGADVLGVVDFSIASDYEIDAAALTSSLAHKIQEDIRVRVEMERVRLVREYATYAARYPSDAVLVYDRAGRLVRGTPGIDQDSIRDAFAHSMPAPKVTHPIFLPSVQMAIGTVLVISRPRRTNYSILAAAS